MMKKITALVLSTLLLLTLFTGVAGAAGKLTVTQESFFVRAYTSKSIAAYVYAQVENTGDKPVKFSSSLFEIFDAEGNVIDNKEPYTCYPEILAPGEVGYLASYITIDDQSDVAFVDDYTLTVVGKAENSDSTLRLPTESAAQEIPYSKYSSEYALLSTVTNDQEDIVRDVTVAFAVYDQNDKLMYVEDSSAYSVGILPGQSVEIRESLYRSELETWESEGLEPTRLETIAFVTVKGE